MNSVHNVAAYILEKCGKMTTMKLQKLLYYSQGWSLAWDEKPIFDEKIEAWANGPVVREVFSRHRGLFTVAAWPDGDHSALSVEQKETVDAVLEAYGDLSGQQLSDMTHGERPWIEARGELPAGTASSEPLDLDVMQDYFGGLALLN